MDKMDLQKIINDYPDCVTNGAKLKGILLDTYPDIPKAIVNTLVIMVNSGIAKEILDSENITELDKSRWQQKLKNEGFAKKTITYGLDLFILCNNNVVVSKLFDVSDKRLYVNQSDFDIKESVLVKFKSDLPVAVIPNGVISIGDEAFYGCSKVTNISIPDSVSSIGNYAFCDCNKLVDIVIPNSVISIGDCAFYDCVELMNVHIPNSVVSIGEKSFCNCSNLINVTIPNGVKSIADSTFFGCSRLTTVTIPSSVIYIEQRAFVACGLINVIIPNSVVSIGDEAFLGCSELQCVSISNNVTFIGNSAFYACEKLRNITIPNSVRSIGNEAFFGCMGLKIVNFNGTKANWQEITKGDIKCGAICKIKCIDGVFL